MQSICAIFSQYAGLTLSLSSGECGPVGAKHAGILPSPVPAVPQPPPPAPQRRARRGSQDLRQDQRRQQARGLRLDEGGKDRWSIKNQRRATLHKETYRRREGRGEGWDPVIPDGGAPLCSHLTFPWNTLSLTPFYCQSYAVKYDCKSLWHPVSPSMIHCEKPDTHTHTPVQAPCRDLTSSTTSLNPGGDRLLGQTFNISPNDTSSPLFFPLLIFISLV